MSPNDTLCLVQLYNEHADILVASFEKPGITHEMKKVWEVTTQVNTITLAERTTKEVVKWWGTLAPKQTFNDIMNKLEELVRAK